MQDQYAGDVGDYVKLGLLRALSAKRELAVAWCRVPDQGGHDGRHTEYLEAVCEAEWRHLDPELYDRLRAVRATKPTILALESILEPIPARFFSDPISTPSIRAVWFARLTQWALRADLLFLDPDNGIASPGRVSSKHVTYEEIEYFRGSARTLIVYHHQTRAEGGHVREIEDIGARLVRPHEYQAVCAIRAHRRSPRVFFIVAPDLEIWNRAKDFAEKWKAHVSFHAITEAPDALGLAPGASVWHRADAAEPLVAEQIADGAYDHLFSPENRLGRTTL